MGLGRQHGEVEPEQTRLVANSDSVGPELVQNQALGLRPALWLPPGPDGCRMLWEEQEASQLCKGCWPAPSEKGRGHDIVTIAAFHSTALLNALLPQRRKSADGL